MIKRYNQGFGGFGPLEECDTGKLMKAKEALTHIESLDCLATSYFNLYEATDKLKDAWRADARMLSTQRNIAIIVSFILLIEDVVIRIIT